MENYNKILHHLINVLLVLSMGLPLTGCDKEDKPKNKTEAIKMTQELFQDYRELLQMIYVAQIELEKDGYEISRLRIQFEADMKISSINQADMINDINEHPEKYIGKTVRIMKKTE
ncbi:MAG: hypothetical protein HQ568_11550 [Calditrichaeota bacterium]|nr:hypothetical protein [Calditrichota bacterium]